MPTTDEKTLLAAACHFGHKKAKWNPKMSPYLYGVRQGVHIFDLVQTKECLETVCQHMTKLQKEGKVILFVCTKQQSAAMIQQIAKDLGQPYVTNKWMPGLLTNWNTLKERIKFYLDLKESFKTGDVEKYTKKEQTMLRKQLAKLEIALSGVATLSTPPDAIFIVDAILDKVALAEANKLGIEVYGICDSNANPDLFTKFVPANDDAVKSVELIVGTVYEAMGGKKKAAEGTKETEESEE